MLLWNLANVEGMMPFLGKSVGVESDQRILGPMFLE